MEQLNRVVEIAKGYIGETEKPKNMGFSDAGFEEKMKGVGFGPGQAWCSYFVELCYKEAGVLPFAELDKLHSASATKTLQNFKDAGYPILKDPLPGCLVVWRHGSGWSGHIGIVSQLVNGDFFKAIEGNTNDQGGREGYIVAEQVRRLKTNFSERGLNLLGFIYPVKN